MLLLLLHPEKWSPAAGVGGGCCDCRPGPAAREQPVGFGVSPWQLRGDTVAGCRCWWFLMKSDECGRRELGVGSVAMTMHLL